MSYINADGGVAGGDPGTMLIVTFYEGTNA